MSELLSAHPDSVPIAMALVVAADLLRRLFTAVGGRVRAFFVTSVAPVAASSLPVDLAGYVLLPVLAMMSFLPALVVLTDIGILVAVRLSFDAGAMVLLWLLVGAFVWLQVWHMMGLAGFFRRGRYLVVLVAVPLLAQLLAWLALDATKAPALARLVAHLICLGVLPYLMPTVHARVLAPLFTAASEVPRTNWRPAVRRFGSGLLMVAAVTIVVWYGHAVGALGSGAGMAYHAAP